MDSCVTIAMLIYATWEYIVVLVCRPFYFHPGTQCNSCHSRVSHLEMYCNAESSVWNWTRAQTWACKVWVIFFLPCSIAAAYPSSCYSCRSVIHLTSEWCGLAGPSKGGLYLLPSSHSSLCSLICLSTTLSLFYSSTSHFKEPLQTYL